MLAKNATAQISATNMRIVFAGSTALTSVYDAPVTAAALGEQQPVPVEPVGGRLEQHEDAEQHGQVDARAAGVTFSPGVCSRTPPNR